MGVECDLSVFDHNMIVGTRWGGLNISETADLLGLSHTQGNKKKTPNEKQKDLYLSGLCRCFSVELHCVRRSLPHCRCLSLFLSFVHVGGPVKR